MLKFIAIAALVVVAAIAVILVYASTRPDTFRVERTTTIKAPPEKIFPLVNDFQRWGEWSPYEKLDPAMKRTYSGAQAGPGAVYAWDSAGKAGAGRMEIRDAPAPSRISIDLHFDKPFKADNVATFTFTPDADRTKVTWAMDGASPLVAKAMGLFFNMDKMVGNDFEVGLANIKAVAERP